MSANGERERMQTQNTFSVMKNEKKKKSDEDAGDDDDESPIIQY